MHLNHPLQDLILAEQSRLGHLSSDSATMTLFDNSKIAAAFDIRLPAWQDGLAFCMA
jgi:hypothetical protein